ncbi:hypothetical protein JW698_01185 [Candidatus Wolfebacteria bacterium]|nr:hypothetical protein [Candidatus Wolfebacteria bacterium]
MEHFLIGTYIGFGVIGVVVIIFVIIGLVYFLAKNNIIWTLAQEGRVKAIMQFNRFRKLVMSYEDHVLDPETWDIKENVSSKLKKKFFSRLGLKLVGVPFIHSVYTYPFRWTSFEQGENNGVLIQKTISHDELLDYILVQDDVYYSFIREAETRDMVPVDLDLLLTIRIVNPYKALFRVQNWLEATQNQLKPVLRSYISDNSFSELIIRKEGLGREAENLLTTRDLGSYLERHYGVRIKKVGIVRIDPSGERGKIYQEAASKQWEAEKESEKIRTLADVEVERIGKVYGKIEEFPDGLSIKMMETIQAGSEKQGNWIIPFSVQDLFKGLMNKGGDK